MPNPKRQRPTNSPQVRTTNLEFRAVEGSSNQYEISFSSETPYMRYGMPEILSHDSDAVDLSRFEDGGPLLFSHGKDPNYGRVPIGRAVKVWLDETTRKCRALIEFDDDENSLLLKSKMEKGMLKGVSTGYTVGTYLELRAGQSSPNGRFTGPAEVAVRWIPHEISLEPVPADPSVGLGKNMNDDEEENPMAKLENPNETTIPAATDEPSVRALAIPSASMVQQVPTDAPNPLETERTRVRDIRTICRNFDIDNAMQDGFVDNGSSVDAVRAAVLDHLQKKSPPVKTGVRGDIGVITDEGDKVRAAAADGLLLRCGIDLKNPAPGATEFRGMSMQMIAVECLVRSGVQNAHRLNRDELFERSMTPDSAFSAIASNVANRVVLAAHETSPTTFQHWTQRGSAPDFRPTEFYEISEAGDLSEIPQNGEFKEARLSDQSVAVRRLLTFGKKVTFTRQLFINDDIELVTRTLEKFALAGARGTNRAVYSLLKLNPTVYDGKKLFDVGHGNLCTGAAPSTAAFSEARRLMRKQKDMSGQAYMNISPEFILSSARDETEIEKLLVSLSDPSSNNSGVSNVFRNRLRLIVDAELDVDTGAQPYYFAADPRLADTIEVAYLNGNESPTVESQPSFDQLGIQFRVYLDRGVTLLGYKGLVKNPGTV